MVHFIDCMLLFRFSLNLAIILHSATRGAERNRSTFFSGNRQTWKWSLRAKMKKVFTPEQISEWFTSQSSFVNLKLSDDAEERKIDEPSSNESR